MKRLVGIVIMGLAISLMVGCSSDSKENTISSADLNDREKTILSTTADDGFVFDFNNKAYGDVTIWMEKYESGELVDDALSSMTAEASEEGYIILTSEKDKDGVSEQTFHIGVGSANGVSSISFTDDIKSEASLSMVYGDLPGEKSLDEDDIVLASFAYSDDEFSVSSLSTSFYEDPAAHMDKLNDYNVVYLLKAKFTE